MGKYKDVLGSWNHECTKCPEGKVALSTGSDSLSKCVDCPRGKVAAIDGNECSGCPPGEYSITATTCGVCQPCDPGKERVGCAGKSEGTCDLCPAGWFKEEGVVGLGAEYTSKCNKCEAGTSTDGKLGSSKASNCVNCVRGTYSSLSGSPSCDVCVSGQFTGAPGNTRCQNCDKCPAGTQRYTAETGELLLCGGTHYDTNGELLLRGTAGTCNNCPNGRVKAVEGQYDTKCTVCPDGKTHSSSRKECVNCPIPTVGASGNGMCATTCDTANGQYPNIARTKCLKLFVKQAIVGPAPSSRRSLMKRVPRRLVDGTVNPTSSNNVINVQVYDPASGLSVFDFDRFVLRLCRVDDPTCEYPIANTTGVVAAAAWGQITIPSSGPTCPVETTTYYIQAGYHYIDTASSKYLGKVVVTRSSEADDFRIVANVSFPLASN